MQGEVGPVGAQGPKGCQGDEGPIGPAGQSINEFQKHQFPSCQIREVMLIYFPLSHQSDGSQTK